MQTIQVRIFERLRLYACVSVSWLCVLALCCAVTSPSAAQGDFATGENFLAMPPVGAHRLRVLGPTVLELTLITTKTPEGRPEPWDFVGDDFAPRLPDSARFRVTANGTPQAVKAVGFKRRVLYAPLKRRDLRIGNELYLELARPVPEGAAVEVRNPDVTLWKPGVKFAARAGRFRWSPAIHVNQTGYVPAFPKKAMVGYYLGSLGEMALPDARVFALVEAGSGKTVFNGRLTPRKDKGFPYAIPPYQRVFEADFSAFKTPGEYRLLVPGLGASFPFFIHDGVAAAFARTYALGLYHQRCGAANALPFTRFVHGPCHTAPAEAPTSPISPPNSGGQGGGFRWVQHELAAESANYKDNPRHTAPQLKDVASSLYPFVNTGKVDVSGGHHDAGDYSKYTINSAMLIHYLVFAADAFPGAGDLDNLGLPESGDGKSDLLQIAKWEADFLAKMQDADGGFYFLVYPRDRTYEQDVLPDHGDPQVVFPKTTAVTAAAVAALAQTASSPRFRRQFPKAAALYLAKARRGWEFLERAWAKYGMDGSYQKITHYGDTFMHDDEIAWAAVEMYLATGERRFHDRLRTMFDPSSPETRRWNWVRLFAAYGCAIRSYAFAEQTGRMTRDKLDAGFLEKCRREILACGQDQADWAAGSAYGTSFPFETKRFRTAGWYFSMEQAFDLAVAYRLDPRPEFLDALLTNMNYEGGANPNNVTFLTGLGWRRQREIVHQYHMNDRRVLPPSGIPLGNIQEGFMYLEPYKRELGRLSFPPDGDKDNPYPFYDRWGDSFNVTTEFVAAIQARGLACLAYLMAMTPLKNQAWRAAPAKIVGVPQRVIEGSRFTVMLEAQGLDLRMARVVWEAGGEEPAFGRSRTFTAARPGPQWIEAEAQLPDGRRAFAAVEFDVSKGHGD
jgi:hypothetical protein